MPGWLHETDVWQNGSTQCSRYVGPAGEVLTEAEFAAEVVRRGLARKSGQ
jgi:hypothetical protein